MSVNVPTDQKSFLAALSDFHLSRGKPPIKIPIMGYKELDIFQLFNEVNKCGGYDEVIKNVGTWSKIWRSLNHDPSLTDSSFRLKKNYERFLLDYEYHVHPEHLTSQDVNKPSKKRPLPGASNPEKKKKTSSEAPCTLPLQLGEITIHSFGQVIPHAPYTTETDVWPIGFCSSRPFSSMVNPAVRVMYTSRIIDSGKFPKFVVVAEDSPDHPIVADSPSGAWRMVLRCVMANDKNDSRKHISVSGRVRFGLAHPTVVSMLKSFPGTEKWQPNKASPKKRSESESEKSSESLSDDNTTGVPVIQRPPKMSISSLLSTEEEVQPQEASAIQTLLMLASVA